MTTKLPKIKEKAKTEALVLDHKEDRYPVQQVATDGEVTKKRGERRRQRNQPRPE